jgi:hypothetical protein
VNGKHRNTREHQTQPGSPTSNHSFSEAFSLATSCHSWKTTTSTSLPYVSGINKKTCTSRTKNIINKETPKHICEPHDVRVRELVEEESGWVGAELSDSGRETVVRDW